MSAALCADRGELQRFIDATFAYADRDSFVSLRCFRDDVDGIALRDNWRCVRVTGNSDDLVDAAEDLATLAAVDDAPVVFAPPVCSFKTAEKADAANVCNGLVITTELDSNPAAGRARLEAVLGPATVVVESGGLWLDPETGEELPKLHLHWRLEKPTRTPIEHDFLKEANQLATTLAGGDPTAVPLVHPLRWAGSWHRKATPRMARIVDSDITREIDLADALNKLREAAKALKSANGHDPAPHKDFSAFEPAELLDVTAAIACIPNNDDDTPHGASWKQWSDMGLRIYAATGGSDIGLALWLDWSKRSKVFDEAETRARWRHYATSPPNKTNPGALFNLAKQHYKNFVRPSELRRQAERDSSEPADWPPPLPPDPKPPASPTEPEPSTPTGPPWPKPLGDAAYHGIAGDFVQLVAPETESDPAALMFQFLAGAGNCFGNKAWAITEQSRQHPNIFNLIVGDSAKARKGTSLRWVFRVLREADPAWETACRASGLSTGEGLIQRVRDPVYKTDNKTGQRELVDVGIQDKRLLIVEEEFSRPIRVMGRSENVLSAVLREAWDGARLSIMTRQHPLVASDATISIIAHVTLAELRAELTEVSLMNGFANRFLFALATRSKELPFGGDVSADAISEIATRLRDAFTRGPGGLILFDQVARRRWIEIYHDLSAAHPGMYGAATTRSEAQVTRVALIYALLDGQEQIGIAHLGAALEIVRYANESVRHIFGDATGNRIEDAILRALRASPNGLTRTQMNTDLFGRNVKSDDIGAALANLKQAGKIHSLSAAPGRGRPAEVWYAFDFLTQGHGNA
jgi:hypothetical protein